MGEGVLVGVEGKIAWAKFRSKLFCSFYYIRILNMKMSMEQREPKQALGAVFEGETIVKCSCCNKELMSIVVYKKLDEPLLAKYRAKCPFCNDHSYVVELDGLTMMGCSAITTFKDIEILGEYTLVTLDKKEE